MQWKKRSSGVGGKEAESRSPLPPFLSTLGTLRPLTMRLNFVEAQLFPKIVLGE